MTKLVSIEYVTKKLMRIFIWRIASEIKIESQPRNNDDEDTRAYTVEEMTAIINEFEKSKIRHLAPIIKLLFFTSCRTGEAVALK